MAGAQHGPSAGPPRQAPAGAGAQEAPPKPMDWREEQLRAAGSAETGSAAGPAEDGSTAGAAAAGPRVWLRPDERAAIRHAVMRDDVAQRHPECRNEERPDFAVGRPYPRLARVCRFPDEVNAKVPKARQYRYLVAGREIVLIDPDDHRIVEVLE
jgi:hypothetical protein